MKLRPTAGYLLVEQKKEQNKGMIVLASQALEHDKIATVIEAGDDPDYPKGTKIFFDPSAGTIYEDNDEHIVLVVSKDDVLLRVE